MFLSRFITITVLFLVAIIIKSLPFILFRLGSMFILHTFVLHFGLSSSWLHFVSSSKFFQNESQYSKTWVLPYLKMSLVFISTWIIFQWDIGFKTLLMLLLAFQVKEKKWDWVRRMEDRRSELCEPEMNKRWSLREAVASFWRPFKARRECTEGIWWEGEHPHSLILKRLTRKR